RATRPRRRARAARALVARRPGPRPCRCRAGGPRRRSSLARSREPARALRSRARRAARASRSETSESEARRAARASHSRSERGASVAAASAASAAGASDRAFTGPEVVLSKRRFVRVLVEAHLGTREVLAFPRGGGRASREQPQPEPYERPPLRRNHQ